ncbi:GATA transcription factor 8 [Cornus florida]|uniref:GATA transcription factor 8 n=1 Tax=Cornus florida TaxID=4283 RepID=UPI0028A25352|nr:GATA transcription factor 8 [Cornus florida]
MIGPNYIDEIDCFFDQIEDLVEFPPENEGQLGAGHCNDFPSIWTNPPEALPVSDPIFSCNNNSNSASDLSAELSVPYEDIVQLEWLSTFVEDSFSGGGMTINQEEKSSVTEMASHKQFQTSSPVSVLESSSSSSSCSGEKTRPLSPTRLGPQRARSKRPRPATFNPRPAMQLISPTSSVTETPQPYLAPVRSSESENFAESRPMKNILKPSAVKYKKRKIKLSLPLGSVEMNQNPTSQSVRKCMHCEITKTPQWRAGPMGPKTLCNACGVRYKSGRLFPEYRPAASPTFIPSVHSNSHKKVLEMRRQDIEPTYSMDGTVTTTEPEPELIPNCNLLLD